MGEHKDVRSGMSAVVDLNTPLGAAEFADLLERTGVRRPRPPQPSATENPLLSQSPNRECVYYT